MKFANFKHRRYGAKSKRARKKSNLNFLSFPMATEIYLSFILMMMPMLNVREILMAHLFTCPIRPKEIARILCVAKEAIIYCYAYR